MSGTSLGFEAKQITFSGKSSHGSEPWNGISALDAAVMTIAGINANRATFKDSDKVRIHPIISNGGDLVNVIPDRAVIETYVRASNVKALNDACQKVDNAAKAGAMALGADCTIENIKGYAPLKQDEDLSKVFEDNALMFISSENVEHNKDMTGSTDMGDVSNILPSIQPTLGGFDGALHSKDFSIANKELVYVTASKILACTVYDLMKDDAKLAKAIKSKFQGGNRMF
jgi:metal-dependent amidase/aminoacylase/carboxypeptidase family protein